MNQTDMLYPLRPTNAVRCLGANPACLLSGRMVQDALAKANSRLVVFEPASAPLLARGILRAAQNMDVMIGLAFRPRPDFRAVHFRGFVRDVLAAADEIGFRHPLVLSAGPFYLTKTDKNSVELLRRQLSEAVDAGFTDAAVALAGTPSAAAARAAAPALRILTERDLMLELVLPPKVQAKNWQAFLADEGIEVGLCSSSEAAGELSRPTPPASWGLRPKDAQLPEAFDLRVSRLTLDPFSDLLMQVISEESLAEVEKFCAKGLRTTDVLGIKPRYLAGIDDEAKQWVETNAYSDALDLFDALALSGSAAAVRQMAEGGAGASETAGNL